MYPYLSRVAVNFKSDILGVKSGHSLCGPRVGRPGRGDGFQTTPLRVSLRLYTGTKSVYIDTCKISPYPFFPGTIVLSDSSSLSGSFSFIIIYYSPRN